MDWEVLKPVTMHPWTPDRPEQTATNPQERRKETDRQRMSVAAKGPTPPSGLREGGHVILQQSQEESISSRSIGDFVFLRTVHAPLMVYKVLEKGRNGSSCSIGPPPTMKFGGMPQARA